MNNESKTLQRGFTFVELMAVIAIMGVLATIALPQYRSYLAKTQHTAAVADISPGKTMVDINLTEGVGHFETPQDVGLHEASRNCTAITVSANSDTGNATISCTLFGNSLIVGKEIKLVRSSDGAWSCESTASAEYVGSCSSVVQ